VFFLAAPGGTWAAMPNLTYPRAGLAAAHYGGLLYAIGGFSGSALPGVSLDLVEAFDGAAWSLAPAMKIARRYFAVVVYACPPKVVPAWRPDADCLYAIGGGPNNNSEIALSRSVEVFDGTAWRVLDRGMWLTTPRMQLGAAVHDGRIFAAGGVLPEGQPPPGADTCFDGEAGGVGVQAFRTIEVFNGERWQVLPNCRMPPHPCRGQVALASLGPSLFFGGALQVSTGVVDTLTIDDAGACMWGRPTNWSTPRSDARMATFADRVFVAGGAGTRPLPTWLASVESLQCSQSGQHERWGSIAPLPLGRAIPAVAAVL